MVEIKVRLSLLVQGANMLSSQECEKNPEENYDKQKVVVIYTKGNGKNKKIIKKPLTINIRKQKLINQNISICEEAYNHMLSTPTAKKFLRPTKTNKNGEVIERVWDTLSVHERLKQHFDLIAHDLRAVSYNYEILND